MRVGRRPPSAAHASRIVREWRSLRYGPGLRWRKGRRCNWGWTGARGSSAAKRDEFRPRPGKAGSEIIFPSRLRGWRLHTRRIVSDAAFVADDAHLALRKRNR